MNTPLVIRLCVWIWLIAAILAGNYRLLQRLPLPATPGILLGLAALLLLLYAKLGALRTWIDRLDLRSLVFLHATRFVGVYLLILYRRGELPYDFAVPAGGGDIIVAVLALGIVFGPMGDARRRRAITIWNVIGLMDLLLVVLTAARIGLAAPWRMLAFTVLPLSLLPTFLVPLLMATHVIIYLRLRRAQPSP